MKIEAVHGYTTGFAFYDRSRLQLGFYRDLAPLYKRRVEL